MLKATDIDLYYGAAQALKRVSIEAEPGKVTCVLGRNGVGKTSLMRAIVGQHPIARGEIVFDGAPLTGSPYSRATSWWTPRAGMGASCAARWRRFAVVSPRRTAKRWRAAGGIG